MNRTPVGQDALAKLRALAEAARDADTAWRAHGRPADDKRILEHATREMLEYACDHATVLALLDEIETFRALDYWMVSATSNGGV